MGKRHASLCPIPAQAERRSGNKGKTASMKFLQVTIARMDMATFAPGAKIISCEVIGLDPSMAQINAKFYSALSRAIRGQKRAPAHSGSRLTPFRCPIESQA
jgi:hypothetical protein